MEADLMSTFSGPATNKLSMLGILRTRSVISQRFANLLSKIAPTPPVLFKFGSHRTSVSNRLKASFELCQVRPIGSAARGSAIKQASDLDLMVILKKQEVSWGDHLMNSNSVLANIRTELDSRFLSTELGKDCQAVTIRFGDGQYPVDVVPAVFGEWLRIPSASVPAYYIPDGSGSWTRTSPAAHDKYIEQADARSGGKLKNVAKMIKYWRWCRSPEIPLNSFHLEMLLASEDLCSGVKSYSTCLADTLAELTRREARALIDPLGISGHIKAANTEAKRVRVARAVQDSSFHAGRALLAERAGDRTEALRQWDFVFNGSFPKD
jgi:predicted nucleotidyltransferase